VNFDFALRDVLVRILESGIRRIVISYDIACKYDIHFMERITHPDWPLFTEKQLKQLAETEIVWLVPKFHLASHIEGCSDKYSFNWTQDVGRTCGELVESNWAGLNGLATSTREMGFGHRRDTLCDAMGDWNWHKATKEGRYSDINQEGYGIECHILALRLHDHFIIMLRLFKKKRSILHTLEAAMSPNMLQHLQNASAKGDGSQYRPKLIEFPGRLKVLQAIQVEELESNPSDQSGRTKGTRSTSITGSVGINMGLDLEMRQ